MLESRGAEGDKTLTGRKEPLQCGFAGLMRLKIRLIFIPTVTNLLGQSAMVWRWISLGGATANILGRLVETVDIKAKTGLPLAINRCISFYIHIATFWFENTNTPGVHTTAEFQSSCNGDFWKLHPPLPVLLWKLLVCFSLDEQKHSQLAYWVFSVTM